MGGIKVLQDDDYESILLSIKDLWTLDLDEKYTINPELIDIVGIRIVIWDIEKLGKKKIITKPYTARTNPFQDRIDIRRITNRNGSYLLVFKNEKELMKRCNTIRMNCSVSKGSKIEIANSSLLIKDLVDLNKANYDMFNKYYKKQYRLTTDFPSDHLLIHREYDKEGNIICGLAALLEDEEESNFELFDAEFVISPDSEEFNKYFRKIEIPTFSCIAKYVDSIEIFNLKEPEKFTKLNNYLDSIKYGLNKQDPLIDDQNELAGLLDYKIDYKFLASFKPNKSVFEYQLIGYDKKSQIILGPIYTSSKLN